MAGLSENRAMIEAISPALDALFEIQGAIYRMYHALAGDKVLIMPAPPGDKDQSTATVREIFTRLGVVRFVLVDEAWTASLENKSVTDAEAQRLMRDGISNHPDRQEVVLLYAEDEAGMMMAHRDIIRPAHGKPRLGPLRFIADERGGSWEGRMVGMLPQRGVRQ